MSRAGARLRAIGARWLDAKTMERLVDPVVADLQAEYESAIRNGRRWHSRRIWCAGHVAFMKVIAWHACDKATAFPKTLTGNDRQVLRRTLAVAGALTIIGTGILTAVPLLSLLEPRRADLVALAGYLVPQALPIVFPVALMFAILWGFGRVTGSGASRRAVMLLAIVASLLSFTMMGWIIPAANSAFRESVAGRPVTESPAELPLGEIGRRLEATSGPRGSSASRGVRALALNYHGRWAIACAPLLLSFFALRMANLTRRGPMVLLIGGAGIVAYGAMMLWANDLGVEGKVPTVAAAWMPNIACVVVAVTARQIRRYHAHGYQNRQ